MSETFAVRRGYLINFDVSLGLMINSRLLLDIIQTLENSASTIRDDALLFIHE